MIEQIQVKCDETGMPVKIQIIGDATLDGRILPNGHYFSGAVLPIEREYPINETYSNWNKLWADIEYQVLVARQSFITELENIEKVGVRDYKEAVKMAFCDGGSEEE